MCYVSCRYRYWALLKEIHTHKVNSANGNEPTRKCVSILVFIQKWKIQIEKKNKINKQMIIHWYLYYCVFESTGLLFNCLYTIYTTYLDVVLCSHRRRYRRQQQAAHFISRLLNSTENVKIKFIYFSSPIMVVRPFNLYFSILQIFCLFIYDFWY